MTNPNWKTAIFTITDEELRATLRNFDMMDSREKRAPWLLKWFMGKGRPRYRWQVWLSNNWPTKEIPKELRRSTIVTKEMENAILEEIMKQIEREKKA